MKARKLLFLRSDCRGPSTQDSVVFKARNRFFSGRSMQRGKDFLIADWGHNSIIVEERTQRRAVACRE
jgi:hypothetical protein